MKRVSMSTRAFRPSGPTRRSVKMPATPQALVEAQGARGAGDADEICAHGADDLHPDAGLAAGARGRRRRAARPRPTVSRNGTRATSALALTNRPLRPASIPPAGWWRTPVRRWAGRAGHRPARDGHIFEDRGAPETSGAMISPTTRRRSPAWGRVINAGALPRTGGRRGEGPQSREPTRPVMPAKTDVPSGHGVQG